MTISRTGLLCLGLLALGYAPPGIAQEPPPAQQPPAAGQQQTPPTQPQEPPATQPPQPAPQPPAPPAPDIRMPGETGWWIGILGWFPTQHPKVDKGKEAQFTNPSLVVFPGKPKIAEGADVGFAVGRHNQLKFYYTEAKASGNFTASHDITVWSQTYSQGDLVSTNYRVQDFKLSFEYLTWPFPVENRRFRLKTLWQVRYLTVRNIFDAPLKPVTDSSGNPLAGPDGGPLSYRTEGSRGVIYPAFGLGVQEWVSRYFRLEANAAGFGLPHRSFVWDADASANVRAGHFELRFGLKVLAYKTSPKAEYYNKGTLAAPFVALRWYSE